MKLWSRGLGKTEIYMDFRYYQLIKDTDNSNNVMLIGNMQDPVNWEFKITMQPEDIGGVMKAMFTIPMIKFIFKNLHQYIVYLINRKKFAEGSGDLVEKVNDAYNQVMNPGGNGRQRRRERIMVESNESGIQTRNEITGNELMQEG